MILHSTSGHTSTARRYLVTNALDGNKFAIIRGANATTDPVIGAGGSLSSGTADFVINNSGNVGIGTASPSFALGTQSKGLHILGAGSTYATLNLQRETNSQGSIIDFSNASNVLQFRIGTNFASGGDKLHFAYGSTPTIGMTLDTSGNVGIGTTTPFSNIFGIDSKLDLTSTGRAILTLHGVLGGNPQEVSLSTGATGFAIDVGGAVSAGSNNIVFRTSNTNSSYSTTERVRITSDGNVGIGTASPQAILNTSVTAGSAGTESTLLRLTKTDGYTSDGTGGSSIVWSNSTNASEFRKIRLTGTGTTRSSLDFIVAGGSVNPTAVAMRIHDSGNVGIGTTNPLNSLHIQNNQNGLTSLRVRNDDTGSSNYSMVAVNSSGNSWGMRMGSVAANNNSLEFVVDAFSSPTPRMTILTGGNVGIGTASPNFKLDVRGTSGNWPAGFYAQGAHYGFTPYTDGGGAGFGYSSTLVMYGAPSATLLYSAGSERMRIDSSGNVGIGTASPQANLEVYRSGSGSANMLRLSRVNGADNHYLNISVDPDNNDAIYSSTGAQGGNHRFFVGNSELMRLSNSLNVSITNLVSCGGIQTNASGVMSCTSDENLKNLGSVYSSGLESIRKIAPQSYSWKEGTPMYDGGILYHGFIAQNIQEALPEAVNVGASGQLQINTTTILASSINAIKDLDLSMQSIESRITALENASSTNDESSSSSLFDSFWQMLADRMASLATSTDAYATSSEEMTGFLSTQFFKTLWSAISVKLAEAANGIERIVARVLEAETVYTNELCLKDSNSENVCVTADQLRLLLSNASGDIDITGGGEGDSAYPSGSGSDISAGESDNTSSTEPEQEPQTSEPPAETDSPEGDTGENQGI